MNKKQLRMVRKTSVNKDGVVELVSPWDTKIKAIRKDRRAKK